MDFEASSFFKILDTTGQHLGHQGQHLGHQFLTPKRKLPGAQNDPKMEPNILDIEGSHLGHQSFRFSFNSVLGGGRRDPEGHRIRRPPWGAKRALGFIDQVLASS